MKYLTYLGVFIFIYILSSLDFTVVYSQMKNIEISYLVLAFLLNFPMIYFKSYRWQQILKQQKVSISLKKAFEYYMSSLYLGFITPGRVGEFSRVLYIKNLFKEMDYGSIFSSVVLDRLFDLYLLVILTTIGFVYLSLSVDILYILLFLSIFFILPFLIIKTSVFIKILNFTASKVSISFQEQTAHFVSNFVSTIKDTASIKNFLKFSFYTVLSYVIFFTQAYLISLSLGMNISLLVITCIMAISNTISLLPISISGIGTRDLILIYFLIPLGFTSEVSVLFSNFILVIFFIGCALIGFFYTLKNPLVFKL
ncbi:MAG: lysylphosphatidylglycerol synthase transmembrane domain-containing protein [Campylobacterota bacterium]